MSPCALIPCSSQASFIFLTLGHHSCFATFIHFSRGVVVHEGQAWFHTDRAAGCHRHHCRADLTSLAGGPIGSRGGTACSVRQQPEANYPGYAQLYFGNRSLSSRHRQYHGYLGPRSANFALNLDFLECAQALLLPYVEQSPLYNAANFSWCIYIKQAGATNSTVYNTRIAAYLCPSDPLAGQQNINSYAGSIGTSTIQYPTDGNTTGVFRVYNNLNQCSSVTLASVTDGTSNTIAFGEGLVGDFTKNDSYRGNGMAGAPILQAESLPQRCRGTTRWPIQPLCSSASVLQLLLEEHGTGYMFRIYCMLLRRCEAK